MAKVKGPRTVTLNSDGYRVSEADGSYVATCAKESDAMLLASIRWDPVVVKPAAEPVK